MATEIVAFLMAVSGWILISSTLPTDYWKVSSVDGTVITTATFWSNLWKTCVTDSTGVSNCKDFPSMLALDGTYFFYISFLKLFSKHNLKPTGSIVRFFFLQRVEYVYLLSKFWINYYPYIDTSKQIC